MRHYITPLSLLLLGVAVAAQAIPTGLNSMPTAEVLNIRASRLDYEYHGSGKLFARTDGSLSGSQGGFLPGIEAGIDRPSGLGTVYNVKLRLKSEGLLFPALAVGAQNIGGDTGVQYYLVGTKSFLIPKVHAGIMRDDNGDTLTMVGANAKLGPIEVKVDRINGGVYGRTGMGASLDLNILTITGTRYDFDNAEDRYTVMVSYKKELF